MTLTFGKLLLIVLIIFVFFGAGKLPRVMGDLGKGIRSLKDGLKGEEEKETADAAAKLLSEQDKKDA